MPAPVRLCALAAPLVLLLTACAAGDGDNAAAAGAASVVRVIDGDTFIADVGGAEESVRLLGIDTPESVDPDQPAECFGKEASARLAELLGPGTTVRLERDVEARDRYGRLLAYVFRTDDGIFVNLSLVEDGYAATLSIAPNVTLAAEFSAAASRARSSGAGLWSACGGPDTPEG